MNEIKIEISKSEPTTPQERQSMKDHAEKVIDRVGMNFNFSESSLSLQTDFSSLQCPSKHPLKLAPSKPISPDERQFLKNHAQKVIARVNHLGSIIRDR